MCVCRPYTEQLMALSPAARRRIGETGSWPSKPGRILQPVGVVDRMKGRDKRCRESIILSLLEAMIMHTCMHVVATAKCTPK